MLVFLAREPQPPSDFGKGDAGSYGVPHQQVVLWSDVHRWMRARSTTVGDQSPAWMFLCREFASFLKEKNMDSDLMTFADIKLPSPVLLVGRV